MWKTPAEWSQWRYVEPWKKQLERKKVAPDIWRFPRVLESDSYADGVLLFMDIACYLYRAPF